MQPLGRGASGIVIKPSGTFVEASGMPGIRKLEMLKVEMMAVFMAKGAKKRSKRSDVFFHRSTHPDPDGHGGGIVVTKKFTFDQFSRMRTGRDARTRTPLGDT